MLRNNKILPNKNLQLKMLLILFLFVFSFSKSWGQATLPVSRTAWGSAVTGFTTSGTTTYGSDVCGTANSSSLKFDDTGDFMIVNYNTSAQNLSFCFLGNSYTPGVFTVEESVNGSTWTSIQVYTTISSSSSTQNLSLNCASRYIRFTYTTKNAGNIAFDNLSITQGTCTSCSAPTTTITPTSQTVCAGTTATIGVTSSAATPNYTWQASANGSTGWTTVANSTPTGASYTGGSTATLTITAGSTYYYRCLITDGTSTCVATSGTSTLVVNTAPSVSTPTISSATSCEGATSATVKINATGSSSFSYQWQVSTGSGYSNIGGAAYSGGTTNTLTIGNSITVGIYSFQCIVTNACGSATSAVSSHTVVSVPSAPPTPSLITSCNPAIISETVVATPPAGVTWYWASNANSPVSYTSAVNNYSATSSGTVYIRAMSDIGTCWNTTVTTNSVVVTVVKSPTISTQPTSSVVCQGTAATIKVSMSASSSTVMTYQWQENTGSGFANVTNGSPYTISVGTYTSTLDIDGTKPIGTYTYQCVISNSCGTVTTNIVTVTITATPANDLCSNATPIVIDASPVIGSLTCASPSSGLTYAATKNDVWYAFTPTCTASHTVTMNFSTSGADYDLDVFTTGACPASGTATYTSHGTSTVETVSQTFTSGVTYYIRIIDWSTSGGTFSVSVSSNCGSPHVVTFDANGGTGVMINQVSTISTNLTTNAFANGSCSFTGWNTAANGSGTSYANNALYSFTVDVTLYAQWNCSPSHTVTFDANGGSGSMSNQVANAATSLTSNAFTNSGCVFVNWNDSANANGTSYANNAIYSFTTDVTLYAQWNCSSGGGSAGCPYLVSAVVNACSGSCNAEGKNEIVVMNSGNYSIPVNGSNINLYYSGGTNHYFTNSFAGVSQSTVVTNLNTLTATSGCTNTPFIFVPSGGTIPSNSNFMILNNNSCFNGDFSAYCNTGPIYVIISTDTDWFPGGYFGNNNTPRYFRTDFSNVNAGCGLTTYNYNNPSTFGFGNDGASVVFNGTTPSYITGNGTCAPSIVILPIDLIDFYATQDGEKNNVVWKVASEKDVLQYIVEKSDDGVNFIELSRVKANSNENVNQTYQIEDNSPNAEITYYRLSTLENINEVKHYKIIDLDRHNKNWQSVLYQTNNELVLEFKNLVPKDAQLLLFDLSGKLISQSLVEQATTKMSVINLVTGIYFAKIESPYKIENFKIIIQNDK